MAVDPRNKDFWARLLKAAGVVKSEVPGEGEFGYDQYGRMLMNPMDAVGKARRYYGNGFNPNEFWYENNGLGAERPRDVLLAQIDPWLNRYRAMYDQGLLSQADANALADHYFRGVGVPDQLKGGNRPQWLSDYIAKALRGLGANNIPDNNVPGWL